MPPDDEAPTIQPNDRSRGSSDGHGVGDRLGRYTLSSLLGQGGFGVVWLAEQAEPVRRRVALKVIKPGMDSGAVLARFDAERQALAVMDHPGIARVLDGGVTPRGLPYFVMELVDGEPIDDFCDRHGLTVNDRIGLFIGVCEAVQHAHMKGVVHRDLKPSNILVVRDDDGSPRARVIDFGIAKALESPLTEQTLMTEQGQLIGTPEYMSPEQAAGSTLDIDTRADVYSLGVVLYELLTGALPFDPESLRGGGLAEMQRIIREDEPPKPSTRIGTLGAGRDTRLITERRSADLRELTTTLRRDLDWIVMRCMEKERDRRYTSPGDIADELRRHLHHEPVLAGPPGAGYRLSKFVRRNRVAVISGSFVAAALVLAVVGTTLGMLWALSERDRAEEAEGVAEARLSDLEIVSDFQSSQLSEINAEAMGAGIRTDLLAEIEAAIAVEPDSASRLEPFAEMLDEANFTNLALGAIDTHVFERALSAIETDFADRPLIRARLLQTVADTLGDLGLFDRAMPPATEALEIRRRLLGDEHRDTLTSINNTGHLLQSQGRLDEAEPLYREALDTRSRLLGEDDPDTLTSMNNMAFLLQARGRFDEAEPLYARALESRRRVLGDDDPATLTSINNMGYFLAGLGRFEEAEPYFREALDGRREMLGDEHPRTLAALSNTAYVIEMQGRHDDAVPMYDEVLRVSRRVLGDDHPETLTSLSNMGAVLEAAGELERADAYYREAFEGEARLRGPDHPSTLLSLYDLASLLIVAERFTEAEPLALECERRNRAVFGDDDGETVYAVELLVRLYEAWHEAEPRAGHDTSAAAWSAELPEEPGG